MKKKFIFALSLSALLVFLIHSCMDESLERQFENEGEKEQLIQNAMRLYYGWVIEEHGW